jgi:hypothetical protein
MPSYIERTHDQDEAAGPDKSFVDRLEAELTRRPGDAASDRKPSPTAPTLNGHRSQHFDARRDMAGERRQLSTGSDRRLRPRPTT